MISTDKQIPVDMNLLKSWLKKNLKEINKNLPFPLKWKRKEDQQDIYTFEGINEHLSLLVRNESAQIQFQFQNDFADILVDLDISPAIDENGKHFCQGCKRPKRYDSKSDLVQDHFINSVKKYQKKNFKRGNFALLCGSKDRDKSFSKIIKEADLINLDRMDLIWKMDQLNTLDLSKKTLKAISKSWLLPYAVERIIL